MKRFEYLFSQSSEKHINLFKTELEGYEIAQCCHIHTYPSNRILQIQIVS